LKTGNFEYQYYNLSESEFPIDRCIGNNARRALVLAEQKDFQEHSALLKKILRAVNLDFEHDVSFLSMQKDEMLNLLNTTHVTEYNHVLLFGIAPSQIGFKMKPGLDLLKLEALTIIVSATLDSISKDALAKRKLWELLKNVFKS